MSDIVVAFHRSRRRPIAPVGPPQLFPARVARQVALAHALQARIASGEFETQAQMARALGLTRARISQLFDLLVLAPDIQEEILLGGTPECRLREPAIRKLSGVVLWSEQRDRWHALLRNRLR